MANSLTREWASSLRLAARIDSLIESADFFMFIPKTGNLSFIGGDKQSPPVGNRRHGDGAVHLALIDHRTGGGVQAEQLAAHGADHHELPDCRGRGPHHFDRLEAPQFLTGRPLKRYQFAAAETHKQPAV